MQHGPCFFWMHTIKMQRGYRTNHAIQARLHLLHALALRSGHTSLDASTHPSSPSKHVSSSMSSISYVCRDSFTRLIIWPVALTKTGSLLLAATIADVWNNYGVIRTSEQIYAAANHVLCLTSLRGMAVALECHADAETTRVESFIVVTEK